MNRWTIVLLLTITAIIIAVFWLPLPYYKTVTPPAADEEIRAAMDIGSGATNMKIAKVNRNTDKIIEQIFDKSIPVPYQKHLEQSSNNTFDEEVRQQGIKAIKELKEIADKYQVKKIVAVATAAFRKAANASQFAQEIERETGVKVRIIDQDEEGILAFRGALALTPVSPQQAVIWDIGGGSMQLTTLTDSGSYLVDKGQTASIPFKNTIIQQVKRQNIQEVQSPNPLNADEIQASLQHAGRAAFAVDPYIKDKIQKPETHVLAVGSLFNYGIRPLVDNRQVATQSELEKAIANLANKTDEELPGKALAEVAVSNPLLVLGYMQELGIDQVQILSVNNADGALTYPAYWDDKE